MNPAKQQELKAHLDAIAQILYSEADPEKLKTLSGIEESPASGKTCIAICANTQTRKAWFGENEELIHWVNQQDLADPLTCLGDGHPGIK